jgi:hypothetical protein
MTELIEMTEMTEMSEMIEMSGTPEMTEMPDSKDRKMMDGWQFLVGGTCECVEEVVS